MLDYKLIEALAKVVQEGGFERAGKALFLTQSAVSQRVRQLEDQCGQLLLTRSSPPSPTAAGKALLKHYQQVSLLEQGLRDSLTLQQEQSRATVAIGINADSLHYWFIDALRPIMAEMNLLIDLRVDDQEQTHRYLREGEVVGCVSNEPKPIQGCRVERLGSMGYHLLAAPDFPRRWFPEGITGEAVAEAPAVLFNRNDRLHAQFLKRHLQLEDISFPAHYIPAPEPFVQMIAQGYCYGMVPDWQAGPLLKANTLIELIPAAEVRIELYWHCWNLTAEPLKRLSDVLVQGASQRLSDL